VPPWTDHSCSFVAKFISANQRKSAANEVFSILAILAIMAILAIPQLRRSGCPFFLHPVILS
jgi:hypothetical protein